MLEIGTIREHFDEAVVGLSKRGISNATDMLSDVLELDKDRRESSNGPGHPVGRGEYKIQGDW